MPTRLILVTLFMALATGVLAQPAPPAPGPGPNPVEVQVGVKADLSPQEMVATGLDYLQKMNGTLKRMQVLREKARKEKDIIRLNCVTDKLVQTKVSITIGEEALSALQEAATRGDDGARIHEFSRVTLVHQKVQILIAEAEACTGEDILVAGPGRVDTDVDPSIPPEDPTQPPPPRPDFDRPPDASPFR